MNVYEASKKRIELLFKEFDNIYVSFSGGKDSGVMLNLVVDYMRKHNITRKIGVFHLDYEAQYQQTTDYVNEVLESNKDIFDVYRVCLPLKVTTCTSMTQAYWFPWKKSKQDIWVRDMPKNSINESNHNFDFWKPKMSDYDFQEKFSTWYHKKINAKRTACLVGIRTQESLHRWRAIHSDKNYKNYNGIKWTKTISDNVYNCYPIYDWLTTDVWIATAKFNWSYNKLYDLYYQAGVGIEQMRVASPFISTAQESLKLYKVIDPNNWAKMVGRVNGVNFTGIYGGTTAMGWQTIKLPKNHTWKSYMYFLLSTLPNEAKENYLSKLETSIKFWKEKGGVLSEETIADLKAANIEIEVGTTTNYNTSKKPVKMEYLDDFEGTDAKLIPTYKRMCICIMKNDHLCKYMGFSLTKNEMQRRKNVIKKYKSIL
jgi:predicted phosphoadenosine phosphosulfate sulfurtransferase